MDDKTRKLRARNKALAKINPLTGLPQFEARGQGRANRPTETFLNRQCDYVVGAKQITFAKKRKDGSKYLVKILKGGRRCKANELSNGRCLEHLGKEIETID